jgi:hypothetical protein
MFRTVPLSIVCLFTVHSAMVYAIQVCRQLLSGTRMELPYNFLQTCMTYTTAECTVNKLLMMDRRTVRNMYSFMPKLICEIGASSWFYYKEIYYDTPSHERKTKPIACVFYQVILLVTCRVFIKERFPVIILELFWSWLRYNSWIIYFQFSVFLKLTFLFLGLNVTYINCTRSGNLTY